MRENVMPNRMFAARVQRLGACVLLAGGALLLTLIPGRSAGQTAAGAGAAAKQPNADLFKLNMKFEGSQSCANAKCHGNDAPQEGKGATTLAELTQWSGGDKHAKAFGQLSEPKGAEIAGKLKIADATTSARCTGCHALPAPKPLQG
jgi:hypothetical protein